MIQEGTSKKKDGVLLVTKREKRSTRSGNARVLPLLIRSADPGVGKSGPQKESKQKLVEGTERSTEGELSEEMKKNFRRGKEPDRHGGES